MSTFVSIRMSVDIHLEKWEQLKAEPAGRSNIYVIKSIPFYARGIAYGDEILTITSEEGYSPVFKSVVKRSGFSTVRLWIAESEDQEKLTEHFTELNTLLEFDGRLVTLAIPRNKYDEVVDYICTEKENGRWGAEEGFLIIDDPTAI
jgi:hypothetical protein